MNILRKLFVAFGVLVLILVVAIGALAFSARISDGPLGVFAGGPLVAGELGTGPEPDWSFTRGIRIIELQLLDPSRSRTTWLVEHEGKIYVASSYMASAIGRLWKQWPVEAERDGRAVVRIDGKRYQRRLVRIKTGSILDGVTAAINRKYGSTMTRAKVEAETVWIFELAPPDSDMTGALT